MTTRVCLAIALCCGLAAPASGQVFQASLDGLQESPPVATPGSGFGTATYNAMTDMLSVSLTFSGLIGTVQDAHIHGNFVDPPSRNATVAIGFSGAGFPLGVTSGMFNASFNMASTATYTGNFLNNFGGGTAAGARNALLAGMTNGTAYFNIHTTFRPGGEIRGDITPIPEPASIVTLLSGLAAIAVGRRRRYRAVLLSR